MKSLIATATYFFDEIQLKKQNLNSIIWVPEFGCQNRYTSYQTAWIRPCCGE